MEPRILLLLLTVVATRGEDTCSRDDVACGDEDLGQRLARIERLSSVNLNRAYEELKVVAVAEPEQPRVLFLLARLQRDLYLKLHVKMRWGSIGRMLITYIQNICYIFKTRLVTHQNV